jgi:hypothetical protein
LLRHLDVLAVEKRAEFNAMIDSLSDARDRNIDWWVSLPATRNTHTGQLFARCVQLALVRDLINQGSAPVVRTDDKALARVLGSVLRDVVLVKGPSRWRNMAHNIASSLFHALSAHGAARRTRHLARSLPEKSGLLEVYVQRDSFDKESFRDRYYPGLVESLDENRRERLFYLPIFHRIRDYGRLFLQLRQAPQNFLLREDYLTLADYLFAFGHWWRAGQMKGMRAAFAGFEIGPLLDAELDAGRFTNASVQALLAYRFWRFRAPFIGATLVDWYEGHDIDHATAAAIRWHGGKTRLVAMRPIAPDAYLSLTPTEGEIRAEVVAKEWVVVGRTRRASMRRSFPALSVGVAPGLRHRMLDALPAVPLDTNVPSVLVMLSSEGAFVDRVAAMLRDAGRQTEWQWLIKRHPAMPRAEMERRFRYVEWVTFVEGEYALSLAGADVVAGLGTNTLIEAAAMGVPVICLSAGNTPAELPFSAEDVAWWRAAYDAPELIAAVRAALTEAPQRTDKALEQLGPFDPAILQAILLP